MSFAGINAHTGKRLDGIEHVKQSIRDILATRIGTRVMRRDYGSRLYELVDNPMGELLRTELFAATAEALERWEPRFALDRVYLSEASSAGSITLNLEGRIMIDNQPITVEGIKVA